MDMLWAMGSYKSFENYSRFGDVVKPQAQTKKKDTRTGTQIIDDMIKGLGG